MLKILFFKIKWFGRDVIVKTMKKKKRKELTTQIIKDNQS